MQNRLYLDNAATSFPKPPAVHQAMADYATRLGAAAGRGGYAEATQTAELIATCRSRLNTLFNGEADHQWVFTLNCSDALNLAIKGLIDPRRGGHVVCTDIDHNSILRPIQAMVDFGWITQTRVPVDAKTGLVDPEAIRQAVQPDTRLIAVTHASNVTGTVQPIREIGRVARECAVPLVVDAAQSAGHVPIDVQADMIDLLAAPGHKALLGPLGTGVLYLRPGVEKLVRPLREGGTGSQSDQPRQPTSMPDKFEVGCHNAVGIAGLSAGLAWVLEQGVDKLYEHEMNLVRTFIDGASGVEGLTYFGPQGVRDRIGVFSFRVEGMEPETLSRELEQQFGILTRSGINCAPLAHETLDTTRFGGLTRYSFGPFLSKQDIKYACDALAQVAMSRVGV